MYTRKHSLNTTYLFLYLLASLKQKYEEYGLVLHFLNTKLSKIHPNSKFLFYKIVAEWCITAQG